MKSKMKSDRRALLSRLSFIFFSFLIVVFFYAQFTIDGVQFEGLRSLGQSAISNLTSQSVGKVSLENSTSLSVPDLRILIGIPTLADHYHKRHFLRLVYGTQFTTSAQVDVRFVFCNLTKEDQTVLVALEIMQYNDILILNCKENMDKGKTYTYFSSLPELYNDPDGPNPPYDYVMKADDDTYFRVEKLVESLRPQPRDDFYYGFVIPCLSMDPFNKYMSGMGYLVSWDLVEWISTSEIPNNHLEGPEDRVFAEWLREGNKAKNRHTPKWGMYNFPNPWTACSHELWEDTIAVHRLKNQEKWITTLLYFNVTKNLAPSKMYHIP